MRGILAILVLSCIVNGCATHTSQIDSEELAQALRSFEIGKPRFDPANPFLKKRVVLLSGELNFAVAQTICEQLVYLDDQPGKQPIKLLINSGGGDGTAYVMIRNTMKSLQAPVDTINLSLCASSAVMLFQSATGKRYALEASAFIIHEPKGSPAKLVKMYREEQEELLRTRCRLPTDWLPLKGRQFVLSGEEALEYEFADAVLAKIDFGSGG